MAAYGDEHFAPDERRLIECGHAGAVGPVFHLVRELQFDQRHTAVRVLVNHANDEVVWCPAMVARPEQSRNAYYYHEL